MDKSFKEQKESGMENKELAKNALSEDELGLVDGAGSVYKAVNSALTELDEEGIDIGGSYCMVWTGQVK